MADLNVMPWFTDSYLADTIDLSDAEHGSYCLLLMAMWRAGGSLPDDPGLLSRIAKVPAKAWPKRWLVLSRFFSKTYDNRLTQKKLAETYRKAIERRDKYVENGKKGAEAKALKNQEAAQATPQPTPSPAIANLKPESLNPNRKIPAPSGAAHKPKKKPTPIPRKEPEELTEAERAKVALFQFGKQCKISGGLINRLYAAYGGDEDMLAACGAAQQILARAAMARDKGAYIGGVIRRIGTEDAERLDGGWDKGL